MSQNLSGGQSLFRARSQQFPEEECVEYQRMSNRELCIFCWALKIKPDEIPRRVRYGVDERWLELEVGLEVAHFSLHATIQSNCIF